MMNFESCEINNIVIYDIGNKYEDGKLRLSESCFLPDDMDVHNLLKSYFLAPFKKDAYYRFAPIEDNLYHNLVYNAVNSIFEDNTNFYEASLNIAQHLFDQSNHPNIKAGELYINIKKLDKACLVFNVESENGYRVSILDKTNSTEAVYWTTDFLGLEQCEDNYFQTSNYLKLCKDFVQEVYNQENDIPKADQIDMLNRSIDYFKKADTFNENLFKEEVVSDPQIIDAFENFKNYYEEKNELALKDQFDVSNSAVKDEKRYFKHVLKLDKNFHVYIHGQKKYIEKGYDSDRDMNYYKLYFREEN